MNENRTSDYAMTVIVPVYNEEENMPLLEERLSAFLRKAAVRSCVLFVNDGSRDASLERIRGICGRNDGFFYISYRTNRGLSTAMKAGIDAAQSRLVGYIDSDLQTDPDDFNALLPYTGEYHLVTGVRADRKDSAGKRLQSKIANSFRRRMTGDEATDTGCPLKILHTDMARRLPFFDGMHRFIAALVMLEGGRMKEIPVRHYPRRNGVSKYRLSNRLVKPLFDCFAFRWMKKRRIRYGIDESNLNA